MIWKADNEIYRLAIILSLGLTILKCGFELGFVIVINQVTVSNCLLCKVVTNHNQTINLESINYTNKPFIDDIGFRVNDLKTRFELGFRI